MLKKNFMKLLICDMAGTIIQENGIVYKTTTVEFASNKNFLSPIIISQNFFIFAIFFFMKHYSCKSFSFYTM